VLTKKIELSIYVLHRSDFPKIQILLLFELLTDHDLMSMKIVSHFGKGESLL